MNKAHRYLETVAFLMVVTRLVLPKRAPLPNIREMVQDELRKMYLRGDISASEYLEAMGAVS